MANMEKTLKKVLQRAKKKGADAAEVYLQQSTGLSASVRMGEVDNIERGTEHHISINLLVDGKEASATVASLDKDRVDAALDGAIRSAKTSTTPNPHARLARPDEFATKFADLDLCDTSETELGDLINMAMEAEDAALAVTGVTNSSGASASQAITDTYLLTSEGFSGHYRRSSNGFYASVVAEKGNEKQLGSEGNGAIYASDLKDPVEIGNKAGKEAVAKLDSKKPKSAKVPVIFSPDVSTSLLSHFVDAVSGNTVALDKSFLAEQMNKTVFADNITIVNDPTIKRGQGSRPFNGEGFAAKKATIVEQGVLKKWFMGIESASKLGLAPEGNSFVGNLYMEAGDISPDDLMADIKDGFYVTNLMSQGADTLTGNYSRAASGFWIKDGKISFPVSQVVIASNMKDMFRDMIPANDFAIEDMRHKSVAAPTLRIPQMSLSGS